ncbi:MAG: MFS transporter [Oscillospiraceae bacterium]|nr:MFS transporter [Oscillospiraceae bacterium]
MKKNVVQKILPKLGMFIPLLVVSAYSSSADFLGPILRNMQNAFPDASLTLVQMTLTLPSAVSIPSQLLTVYLAQKMTKKQLVGLALLFICIGGLIPAILHHNIIFVVISSFILGIGQGFFIPSFNAILSELFDGNTRATFLGIKGGISSLLKALMNIIVGFLGAAIWSRAYLVFVILIPLILWFWLVTPKGEVGAPLVGKGVGLKGIRGVITPAFVIVTILCSCASCCQMAYNTNIAGFIADRNLGGSVTAGAASAFFTMAKLVVGFTLGLLLRAFKRFTLPIGYGLCALGYFIISRATGLAGVQLGGIVYGLGLGIQMSGGLYYITETVDKKYLGQMMGLYFPAISFLISMSPVIINGISKGVFGEVNATNNFMAGCLGYATVALLMFLYQLFFCKNSMIGKLSGLEDEESADAKEALETAPSEE